MSARIGHRFQILRQFLPALAICLPMAFSASGRKRGAGGGNNGGGVGVISTRPWGVSINVGRHVLSNAEARPALRLKQAREKAMQGVSADFKGISELRKISLRGLQEAIARTRAARIRGQPLPDALQLLAGLKKIQYISSTPTSKTSSLLVRPKVGRAPSASGNIVGETSGPP